MADRVREVMESMVAELEDLERRGLCSRAEVKQLTQRRRRFEYLVHRPQVTKEDFLRYLQFELNFESLLKCRRTRLGMSKRSGANFALRRRIHFIFSRALNRFKGDERLWLQWIDYAQRRKADKRLERIFGRALAVLPNATELWIRAAAWEFEMRSNSTAARRLLQRALRANPRSSSLWLAYFRFELIFGEKMRRRRVVLGVADPDPTVGLADGATVDEMRGQSPADIDDGSVSGEPASGLGSHESADGGAVDGIGSGQTSGDAAGMPPWCAVPALVFQQAAQQLEGDANLLLGCLQACGDFATAAPLARSIEERLRGAFAEDPSVAMALASLPLERCEEAPWTSKHSTAVQQGMRSLDRSVAQAPTPRIFEACSEWAVRTMRRPGLSVQVAEQLHKYALRLCKAAHKAGAVTPSLYACWALLQITRSPIEWQPNLAEVARSRHAWQQLLATCPSGDEVDAALRVCENGIKLFPQDETLVCLSLQLTLLKHGRITSLSDLVTLRKEFRGATRSLSDHPGLASVWRIWMESALAADDAVDKVDAILDVWRQAATELKHSCGELKVVLAEWICAHLESSRVRKVSGLVLQSPPTPLKVYELFIEKLMDAQTSKFVGTKGAARVPIELNRLFEQAISEYGRNAVDVWLWYATCHLRCADFTMAAAIYDRALKMLRQDLHGDFTARYQEAVQVEAV